MRRVRRVVKRPREAEREKEREEEKAQFLLNKEVSRTKQLMSLRLGGPARGFVLITSRRESERGEVRGGEEETRPLFSSFLSPPLSPFFSPRPLRSFSVPLSFSPPFLSPANDAGRGGKEGGGRRGRGGGGRGALKK